MAVPVIQMTDNQFRQYFNFIKPPVAAPEPSGSRRIYTLMQGGLFFVAMSIWTQVTGVWLYNSGTHINRYLQNLGVFPTQKFPDIDFGKVDFGQVVLPNVNNKDSFLAEFNDLLAQMALGIDRFTDSVSNSSAKVVIGVGSACLSLYIFYSALRLGHKFAEKKLIDPLGRPTLSRTYHMDDRISRIYKAIMSPVEWVYSIFSPPKEAKEKPIPIFNADIGDKITEMIDAIGSINEAGGSFYNVLLWGPPGTGKTMGAEYIARCAGVNFIEISGGDIVKFMGSNQHPVALLDQVFNRMNASDKPVILFIDELDAIGLDRSRLDPPRVEILNTLLNLTGTPSNQIILMGATNRPKDLDSALLSRFSERWQISLPENKVRLEILNMYIHYFFKDDEDLSLFTPEFLEEISRLLEGQSGRSIYALVNKWLVKKTRSSNSLLTKELVLKSTLSFLEQQNELKCSTPSKS